MVVDEKKGGVIPIKRPIPDIICTAVCPNMPTEVYVQIFPI